MSLPAILKKGYEMMFNLSLVAGQVSSAVLKRQRNTFGCYGRYHDWREDDYTSRRGLRYERIDLSRNKVEWNCNEYVFLLEWVG